ncbi:MAG: DUF5947 family protein [Streptosporangiaceae bacterium]
MTRPPSGLRRFARPGPPQAAPAEQIAPAPPSSAEAAASTLPPLVAELLQAANPAGADLAADDGGDPESSFSRLREVAAAVPSPAAAPDIERCELCKVELPPEHGHIADLENQTLECACRACYLLFTRPNATHMRYQAIPDRYLKDPERTLTPAQFDQLEIPVGLAFFMHSSAADGVIGFYPSPAGATECVLDLGAWERLTAEHPLLGELVADVEAALISRADREDRGVEYFLVPIDACYELVGRMRLQWRGFDGGAEARASITDFLEHVRARAAVFAAGITP